MKTVARILFCGAVFAASLPIAFLLTQLYYDAEVLIPSDISALDIAVLFAGAGMTVWTAGCVLATLVIGIERITGHFKYPKVLSMAVGALIGATPSLVIMIRGASLFISQDQVILVLAGLSGGVAVALTTPQQDHGAE